MIAMTNRVAVMEGALGGLSLADILQVVGIGRQFTGVELRTEDHAPAGTIFVKSGKVVWADTQGVQGKEAFFRLFQTPSTSFHVFRTELPQALPEPIGTVPSLLAELSAFEEAAREGLPALMTRARSVQAALAEEAAAALPARSTLAEEAAAAQPAREMIRDVTEQTPPARAEKRVLAVCSPKGGTGKTTVALNLAVSLARQGVSVALVDGSTHGDIGMATDAGTRTRAGVFDVLTERLSLDEALTPTSLEGLSVLFSLGSRLPSPAVLQADHTQAWRELLGRAAERFQVVVVDTPAGMLGTTQQILGASTHVLGVLQSEVLSQRAMGMFKFALEALPTEQRPAVLGILINMVQVRQGTSLDVLKELGESLPPSWIFETTLPRHPAFLDATRVGLPLRLIDQQHPPSVAWLFDALAGEISERLSLASQEPGPTAQRLFS